MKCIECLRCKNMISYDEWDFGGIECVSCNKKYYLECEDDESGPDGGHTHTIQEEDIDDK